MKLEFRILFFPIRDRRSRSQKNPHHVPWLNPKSFCSCFFRKMIVPISIIYGVEATQERRGIVMKIWFCGSTNLIPRPHEHRKRRQTVTKKKVKPCESNFIILFHFIVKVLERKTINARSMTLRKEKEIKKIQLVGMRTITKWKLWNIKLWVILLRFLASVRSQLHIGY